MADVSHHPRRTEKAKSEKRARSPDQYTAEEKVRRRNVNTTTVLGESDLRAKALEKLVFGAEDEFLERLAEQGDVQPPGILLDGDGESGQSEDESEAKQQPPPVKKPVWVDEDDELEEEVDMKHRFRKNLMKGESESKMTKQKLQQRMREHFQKSMGGAPSWASSSKKKMLADEEEEENEDDDLMRRTGTFVTSSDSLCSGILRMKKCLNANSARPSEDRLTTVQFHPSAQVVLTAGLDRSLSLFQVDGKTNSKIQSIHLDQFPVHKAQFSKDGETVIATGFKNKTFYMYNMIEGHVTPVHTVRGLNEARVKEFSVCPEGDLLLLTGTNGYLHLLTLNTKEVVRSMKMNGNVCNVAFSSDGGKIFANSEEGEVYVWDLRSGRCLNRFLDDGCVRGTSIATSQNGQYLACGSQAGVVNIYSQAACQNLSNPKPLKAVMNLLTPATSVTFNPTSEILAMASRAEDEAVRLVHLPSLTVFSNFPISRRKVIYRASCLDFSPHSGFFSVANNKGHAPLYRLLHYKSF